MANQFRFNNFVNDVEKLLDMLTLNKEEFLKSYSYLTPEEYDNTVTRVGPIGSYKFVSNILDVMRRQKSELVLRMAFNHLFDIGANSLKDVSYDYIRENVSGNALRTDAFAQDIVVYAKHLSRLPFIEMAVWFSRNIEYDVGDNKPSYKRLEEIANNIRGVDKSFAIKAGREIRVIAQPDKVTDAEMPMLAREIAKKVEEELDYPGQIKVNIVRETRAVDYAK